MLSRQSFTAVQKVTLAAITLFLIGVIPLAIYNLDRIERQMTRVLTEQQFAATGFVANDLEQKILLRVASLQDIARQIPADRIGDHGWVQNYMSQRLAIYRLFANGVFVIGRDGQYIADWPRVAKRQNSTWNGIEYFEEAIRTGRTVIANPRIGRATGLPGLAIGVPIKNPAGEVVAVMAGVIGLSDRTIFDQAFNQSPGAAAYTLISISNGLVVSDPDSQKILQSIDRVFSAPVLSALRDSADGVRAVRASGSEPAVFVAHRKILDGKLMVVNVTPESLVLRPLVDLRNQILQAYLIAVFVIAVMIWLVMHYLLRPVINTTRQIRRMVDGEIPIETQPVTRRDELGDLLMAFNKLFSQIQSSQAALEDQAHTDFLTGLPNRRYFMEQAEAELARRRRFGKGVAVCMLDIDHFKRVNDAYGHKAGDLVLERVARQLRESLREVDIVGRFGGEEFACVLPEAGRSGAVDTMERVRAQIGELPVTLESGAVVRVTISIGIALSSNVQHDTLDGLIQRADEALYDAKLIRNSISVAAPHPDPSS